MAAAVARNLPRDQAEVGGVERKRRLAAVLPPAGPLAGAGAEIGRAHV